MVYLFLPHVLIVFSGLVYLVYKLIEWLGLKIGGNPCKAGEDGMLDLPLPPTADHNTPVKPYMLDLLAPLHGPLFHPARLFLKYSSNILLDLLRKHPAGVNISLHEELMDVVVHKQDIALSPPAD